MSFLAQSALFAPLSEREKSVVARQLVRRQHGKDKYLFFEGDPAEWLIFVAEGQVKMIKHSEGGRETILATFGPGQIVGEVGVLVGDVYPATAQAHGADRHAQPAPRRLHARCCAPTPTWPGR